jgi:hypothetical protein
LGKAAETGQLGKTVSLNHSLLAKSGAGQEVELYENARFANNGLPSFISFGTFP